VSAVEVEYRGRLAVCLPAELPEIVAGWLPAAPADALADLAARLAAGDVRGYTAAEEVADGLGLEVRPPWGGCEVVRVRWEPAPDGGLLGLASVSLRYPDDVDDVPCTYMAAEAVASAVGALRVAAGPGGAATWARGVTRREDREVRRAARLLADQDPAS